MGTADRQARKIAERLINNAARMVGVVEVRAHRRADHKRRLAAGCWNTSQYASTRIICGCVYCGPARCPPRPAA